MELKLPKSNSGVNASLVKRFIAFIVDFLLIEFIIVAPFGKIISNYIIEGTFEETFSYMMSTDALFAQLYPIIITITLLAIAYFAIFEYKYGQTPGKMLLKLKVISQTKKLLPWQLVVRALLLIPFYPLTFIDVIYVFFNQDNQRVLEYLSKTKTVQL
tara:strand:- start:116 stop:589 length:474 start_codon:yes stop_codon:yes gene_type:complete